MPGQFLYSSEDILNEIESLKDCGINTVALFPNINTEVKDPLSKEALNEKQFYVPTCSKNKERVSRHNVSFRCCTRPI